MKLVFLVLYLFTLQAVVAQPARLDDPNLTLAERYALMKTKAQTYGEYKAVKETDLDAVYKTMRDSLQATKAGLSTSNKSISALQIQVDSLRTSIQAKEASVQAIIYDSTHISVLGVKFNKSFFKALVGIMLAVMIVALVTVIGRMKSMQRTLKEKSDLAAETVLEFAEYKRHAMEKQTKLARELQTELNKPGR